MRRSWPIRSAFASSTAASTPAYRPTAGNVVLERIAYGLYNMGLDIRRRATEDLALIRRSLGEHTASCGPSRPAIPSGRARDGRPSRPYRGKHTRRH